MTTKLSYVVSLSAVLTLVLGSFEVHGQPTPLVGKRRPRKGPAAVRNTQEKPSPISTSPAMQDERFASLRDPFWPVGFTPQAEAESEEEEPATLEPVHEEQEAPAFDAMVKQLSVRGVMETGGEYVAMVNDQVVREGDLVSLVSNNLRYRWKVRAIGTRGVRFEPYDTTPAQSGQPKQAPRIDIKRVIDK